MEPKGDCAAGLAVIPPKGEAAVAAGAPPPSCRSPKEKVDAAADAAVVGVVTGTCPNTD